MRGSAARSLLRTRRADPQPAVPARLDPVERQPGDVDEQGRRLDAEPHQVDEVRAAAEERRARRRPSRRDRRRARRRRARSGTASPSRHLLDRGDDVRVGAAAAQVAAHPLADLVRVEPRQRRRRSASRGSASRPRPRPASRRPSRSGPACSSRTGSASCSMNAVLQRVQLAVRAASPSIVVTSAPSCATASARQRWPAGRRGARCRRRTGRGRSPSSRRSGRGARAAGRAATCACRRRAGARRR